MPSAMGGGFTVNGEGSISAPSYTVINVDGSISMVNSVSNATIHAAIAKLAKKRSNARCGEQSDVAP